MRRKLLDILICPSCQGGLNLTALQEVEQRIEEGVLQCARCGERYPVVDGIPRFVPNALSLHPGFVKKYPDALGMKASNGREDLFKEVHGSTQERFSYEWMRYPGSLPEDKPVFLDETQIPPDEWRGKRIMDAGCGMGRYSRVAHELGADVVAIDLGTALIRLKDLADQSDRMHIVQGNLMSPPIKKESFDIVYSLGVIHHTPSAHATFKKLAELVKPGGQISVWVYGTNGPYANFKTNPLKSSRAFLGALRWPVWLIGHIREFLSDTLRLVTVHLPHSLVYGISYPLAALGKVPGLKYLTFSVHPLWRVRVQENFDWLSPPYQSHHTKEELSGWNEACGFKVLRILPHGFVPKPGVLGKKSS